MLPLCSAPLIALLVAGEVEDCSMMDRIMLGYHNISYLINASIYLVKGGRLGLMPGVLFHSCRPSFRHTGVMFPDFAFLTRSGDLWDPLTIRFEQNSSSKAQPWFYHLPHLALFPLGFRSPRVIFIFPPPPWASAPPSVGPTWAMSGAPWATRVYANPTSCPSGVP